MTRSKPTIEIYRGWREIAVSDEHLAVFCEGKDPISLEDKMEGDILGEFQDLNPNEYILLIFEYMHKDHPLLNFVHTLLLYILYFPFPMHLYKYFECSVLLYVV